MDDEKDLERSKQLATVALNKQYRDIREKILSQP